MSHPANYKPSPLSFGSPRASPFRRPESPSSPSTTIRPTTPTHTSTKPTTPSKLREASAPPSSDNVWTPRGQNLLSVTPREAPASPTRNGGGAGSISTTSPSSGAVAAALVATGQKEGHVLPPTRENGNERVFKDVSLPVPRIGYNDALSRLPAAQVREMREAYQILDRDNDGRVNREDVADILGSLGLESSGPTLGAYFPPSQSQTIALPTYLSTLSNLLAPLSPPSELLAAFDAFDDDDSGQIDVAELRDALLHTSPDIGEKALTEREVNEVMEGWVGRRAFGKGLSAGALKGKAEVFRYREWVAGLGSIGEGGKEAQAVS